MKNEVLSQINAVNFRRTLLRWFDAHARDLPWRRSKAPYHVWLSEILLQQTRVDQGTPYYERFIAAFPTVQDLAAAQEDAVLKLWEGLGYYARARNLLRAAREIVQKGGAFPKTAEQWQTLPGIGRYTAGAIASIAFNERTPLVDGNVARVLCRVYNIRSLLTATETQAQLWSLAEHLVPIHRPGDFNQALMELGALVCLPRGPHCPECPLRQVCMAHQEGVEEQLPRRVAKKPIPHHELLVAFLSKAGKGKREHFLLVKRPSKGLLGGLWEFPACKQTSDDSPEELLLQYLNSHLGIQGNIGELVGTVTHVYSHFRTTLHAYRCCFTSGTPVSKDHAEVRWISAAELHTVSLTGASHKILELLGLIS